MANDVDYCDVDHRLRAAAAARPEGLAVADSRRRLTWAEFDLRVNRIANALTAVR